MWNMAMSSVTLFMQGKLFAEPGKVFRQTLIGMIASALVLVVLAKSGLSLPVAAAIAGIVGGALQPWLFKDLRYL